ncbi:MAG: TetR/AcrR family transcriptional regulator [Deltaproteobacteria bacterium]|nr:TetR/AcrR family transcriptional regulator [Deltaproteobacteria bacterium]
MLASSESRRAARLPGPLRREGILDAAITVFARVGYRAGATAAIAAELGVSEPTLFRHFPTKRDLYLAALDRSAELTMRQWREIAAAAASPLAALLAMGQWYFAELQRDSQHLRLRFRSYSEVADEELAARARAHVDAAFRFVRDLYEQARAGGEIAADTDVQSHTWLFMAVGLLLDVTQLLGMRAALPLTAMPGIMQLIAPRPANPTGDSA